MDQLSKLSWVSSLGTLLRWLPLLLVMLLLLPLRVLMLLVLLVLLSCVVYTAASWLRRLARTWLLVTETTRDGGPELPPDLLIINIIIIITVIITVIISPYLWGTAGKNFLLMLVVTTLVDIMASTSRRMEVYLHTCHQHDYLEGEGNEWHLWPGSSSTE